MGNTPSYKSILKSFSCYPVRTLILAFLYETGKIAAPADINMIDITDAKRLNANVVTLKASPRF